MFGKLFRKFFPVPDFLMMPSVGLDISETSIKFVELKPFKLGFRLSRFGSISTPEGSFSAGKIVDAGKMKEALIKLKKDYNLDYVKVTIPEEQIYLFELNLPLVSLSEIKSSIELQLEEHIPISGSETVFDFSIISKNESGYKVQVAATSKSIVDGYMNLLESASLKPLSFKLGAQAIANSVIKKGDNITCMIVDFGNVHTCISIVSAGYTLFTSTIDFGGQDLTKIIAKGLNLSLQESEDKKKQFGLSKPEGNESEKDPFPILLNALAVLRDEISKNYLYWHTHKDEKGFPRVEIEKIIMCGGNSNLRGLSEYLSSTMKVKIELANVWINVNSFDNYIPEINFNSSLGFASAVGMAL